MALLGRAPSRVELVIEPPEPESYYLWRSLSRPVALVLSVFVASTSLMSWTTQLTTGVRPAPNWFVQAALKLCSATEKLECLLPAVKTLPDLIESASAAGRLGAPFNPAPELIPR
jgi:hypothetical protein